MKAFATFGTAVLFLSLGTLVPAFAQHEQEEAKPEQKQQQEHAQPQPQQHAQQHAQQQNQNKQQQQQQARQQNVQQPGQHTQEQQRVQQAAWQGHRSENWQSDHRTWEQRGGYNGYRIPDNRYNGYFGPEHGFVIYSHPIWLLAGSRDSSTTAFGSLLLTRGRATGQTTGARLTTFTWSTLTMDITCTTSVTPASALQSTSRYKALPARGRERLRSQRTADPEV